MNSTSQLELGQVTTLKKTIECGFNPVSLFSRLETSGVSCNRILLESSEIESKQQLKSILVNKAALRIECRDNKVVIRSLSPNGNNALKHLEQLLGAEIIIDKKATQRLVLSYLTPEERAQQPKENLDEESRLVEVTPIDSLRCISNAFANDNKNPYSIFLAGLFSFDFIASFEQLPEIPYAENDCADFVFYLAEEVIVYDHQTQVSQIHSNIFSGEDFQKNYYEQSRRIASISEQVLSSNESDGEIVTSDFAATGMSDANLNCDVSDQDYQLTVSKLKQEIIAGNLFQVVPSRTFSLACEQPLASYRKLKQSNPSPYMFYMQDKNFDLFGASPESALKYQSQSSQVALYPIAGTRIRGKNRLGELDHDLDKRLEVELKLDQKEISEHMMLVDLARNDIARITTANSVTIPRLLEVDRYSQVMHLVSLVQGELKPELDCFHAYQACMNMGTLTGAPKIKATETIRQTEGKRRGSYGGAVGYINANGDMDTCIVIRSAFCRDGMAYIQAGAGVVYDSDPKSECDETKSKAKAVIQAIQLANPTQSNQQEIRND
jgi:anthranilate synthase component 1